MGKHEKRFSSLYRKLYYGVFLFIALAVIYLLFPKQGTFKYEFQKGKPWSHATLIAPYDYPVLKPTEVYEAEKDSALKSYIPYFRVNPDVLSQQLSELQIDLDQAFDEYPGTTDTDQRRRVYQLFASIYSGIYAQGILENALESYPPMEGKSMFNKVENNLAVLIPDTLVYSLKTAYEKSNQLAMELAKKDTLFLAMQRFIDMSQYLSPNLIYDENINYTQTEELLKSISTTKGVIPEGVRIISEGDIVTGDIYLALESLRTSIEQKRSYGKWTSSVMFGQMILIIMLLTTMVLYLQNFNRVLFKKKRNFSLIITVVLGTIFMVSFFNDYTAVNIYLLPVCLLPIIIRTFLGSRVAIFIHIISMLLIGFIAPNSFEYVLIQIVAGTIAVVSLSRLHRRWHLMITASFIVLAYALMYIGFGLIKEGSFRGIDWMELIWFAGNGLLLLITYLLIYVFEKIFGFVSDVTLMELSDTNHPLLRQLAEVAPGTFQHSMQVANLSEEVVRRLGGNTMLVRTGALYHDVGKIKYSQYFIENQGGGRNPHDGMSKVESAGKIINHVQDGVTMAQKFNLPESIIDFIRTHHGKSMARYFYLKYKEEHPGEAVPVDLFTYPGPNPNTRETAIVMLADGVEATTRSLSEKNDETIRNAINQIIDAKVVNHELDDAPLTFSDIKAIKEIFFEKLKNIYHLRIQYPSEEQADQSKT
jgi:cyclic-di-AMP phosphodiesterase PgpH